jgi:hypothetical protein
MNDDRLRRLLSDAVSDVEPRERLDAIRAAVRSDQTVVPVSRSRSWAYAAGGIVATAAVIGVVAFATGAVPGLEHTDRTAVGVGQPTDSSPSLSTPRSTPPPSTTPSATSSTAAAGAPSSPAAYAVYYVGTDPRGRPVLYREFHRPDLPGGTVGSDADLLTEAVHDAVSRAPLDPDYVSPWSGHATFDRATYDRARGSLTVSLLGNHLELRPAGMARAEARAAVQQLVYTAEGAVGSRVPVRFVSGDQPLQTLYGVDVSSPVRAGRALDTLSLVSISDPNNGESVSGSLKVTGVNNAFEGGVVVYLERNGKRHLVSPTIGGWGGNKLYPWSVTLDLTRVKPGTYRLVAENDDPSGRGRPETDDRVVTVK